jgi:hypothetical protein
LKDKDPNVRWPAANLLGRCGDSQKALPALRQALQDDDFQVRIQALRALGWLGPDALAAVPDLTELLRDPDALIRAHAERALWNIHTAKAVEATGWEVFTSAEWNFSAAYPVVPEEELQVVETPNGHSVAHTFAVVHTGMHCVVIITKFPRHVVAASTEDQRLDAARDLVLAKTDGKLREEKPIEQHGSKGREYVIDVEGNRVVQTRHFWAGRRLYQVSVTFPPKFWNAKAADYFLDSFQLDGPP